MHYMALKVKCMFPHVRFLTPIKHAIKLVLSKHSKTRRFLVMRKNHMFL